MKSFSWPELKYFEEVCMTTGVEEECPLLL
jgi:hypothetical protein